MPIAKDCVAKYKIKEEQVTTNALRKDLKTQNAFALTFNTDSFIAKLFTGTVILAVAGK